MQRKPTARPPVDIFGEVLFDCFPDGRRMLGGAPFNVAWHLGAFGVAPRLISAVGADPDGERVRRAMRDWGLDTSAVQTDPEHPTGVVQVSLEDGEPSYEIVPNRAFDHIHAADLPDPAPLLYHGTLALRGPVSAATLATLTGRGPAIRFVDVNLRDPWWSLETTRALVQDADWVKLNRDELAVLAGGPEPDPARIETRAAEVLERFGLAGLVVTLGSEGALALSRESREPVRVAPAPVLQVQDTVGAGDAFASVLILGLLRQWPLATTLERAQSFASRIVAQPGPTAADPRLYRPFITAWNLGDGRRDA